MKLRSRSRKRLACSATTFPVRLMLVSHNRSGRALAHLVHDAHGPVLVLLELLDHLDLVLELGVLF